MEMKLKTESKLTTESKLKSSTSDKSNSNEKGKELSKLEEKLHSEITTLQAKRGKKRYTIDNRLCQNPFKFKGEYFFDCTDTETPDKSQSGKEWCYVEAPQVGDKTWEFCIPILDYDKLREHVQSEMKKISIDTKKLNEEVNNVIGPAQKAFDDLRRIKETQSQLSTRLSELAKDISTLSNNINNLNDLKNQWLKLEDNSTQLASVIERKVIVRQAQEANNFNKVLETTADVIKAEESTNKQKINPALQYKLVDTSNDCQGKLMYEDEGNGDGVTASYFDNMDFLGEFKETKEHNINFDWTGDSPAENINPSVFSARFEGYVFAPVTSNYFFSLECDDGCQLSVNNDVVISHKMNFSIADSKERVDKWLNREVAAKLSTSGQLYKSKSKGVYLLGGTKYKIVVLYSHSVHNDSQNLGKSFLKLYWASDDFEEKIVSRNDLYSQSANPPIKITNIHSDNMITRKLIENDLAFKDSSKYVLQDIPEDYVGSTCIKLDKKYKDPSINFEVNISTYVYVARFEHYPKCLSNDWENTGERLSILEVPTTLNSVGQTRFDSARSGVMKIYRKKFDAGYISIPLNRQSINSKGIPLVVFFGADSSMLNPVSCGGPEIWVSDPTSKSYSDCSSSSFWESTWKCENGLNGRNRDTEGSMWATRREGIGAWIEAKFKDTYFLTRVEIKNRRNAQERNSLLEISFSNGKKQIIKLPNSEDIISIPLDPPTKSNMIRFTIKGVYGTINNGGAFKVYGLECKDIDNDVLTSSNYVSTSAAFTSGVASKGGVNPKMLAPLFKPQEKPPVVLLCKDSLSNMKKLDHVKLKPGSQVKIRCLETCYDSGYPVYGDLKYTKDSAICKAAYHSGILSKPKEVIWIKFHEGLNNYPSQTRNGVKTKGKSFSELSITFETAQSQDNIVINTGSKFDLLDPNGSGTWLPAVILNIEDSGQMKKITVNIEKTEGNTSQHIVNYPDKSRIMPCGSKIHKRICDGSSLNTDSQEPIKIKFEPENYPRKTRFLIDSGLPFGKSGKSYGWDRDMSNRVRARDKASDPLLETLVEFPPDQNSKFCNTEKPEVVCDKANWSAKVGFGKFIVKLHIGDPLANTRVDLTVNGEPFVKQTTIEKGKLEVFEGVFDSVNEFITIGTKCILDCEYSMAKLNMIEIAPNKEPSDQKTEPTPVVQDPCGNAQQGGKCETGPDVTHCLFDDPSTDSAKYCSGNSIMLQVPANYKCASQRNKYKCVFRKYESQGSCLVFCPFNCTNGMCNA